MNHCHAKALLLAACWCAWPAQGQSALTPQEIYTRALPVVLLLEARDQKDEVLLAATAIALAPGRAVTQCDLLPDGHRLTVTQARRVYGAYARERDVARNLCLLDVPGLKVAPVDLVPAGAARVGQRAYAVGNALGMGLSLSEGVVSGLREEGGETWIQTTAALAPGSEGGALFDEQGRLLGMTDYRKRDGQNINFAAPASWLPEVARRALSVDQAGTEDARRSGECLRLAQAGDWVALGKTAEAWAQARPEHGEAWYWLGRAVEEGGLYEAAAGAFDKALQRSPDAVNYTLALARNQMRLKQADKALEVLRQAIAQHQEEADLWFARVLAEDALGLGQEGLRSLEMTLRLNRGHAGAWELRHAIARARQDWESMRQAAQALSRIAPDNAGYWATLAQANLLTGRLPRALKAIDRAQAIAPGNGDHLILRGAILAALGARAQAIETLKRGLDAKPTLRAYGLAQLGNAYYQALLYPEAIAALREAVNLVPDNLNYQYDLGLALKDGGLDEEALPLFQALREKTPKDPAPWRQVGFTQAKLGQYAEAVEALEQSLRLEPRQAKAWHALGETYVRMGRVEEARRVYPRLRELDSGRAEQFHRGYLLVQEDRP